MDDERDAKRPRLDSHNSIQVEGNVAISDQPNESSVVPQESNDTTDPEEGNAIEPVLEDVPAENVSSDELGSSDEIPESDEENIVEIELEMLVDELEKSIDYQGNSDPVGRPLVALPDEIARDIRRDLFSGGALFWLNKYRLESQKYSAPELMSALGFPLPLEILDKFSTQLLELGLQIAMRHVSSKRQRLPSPRTLDELAEAIERASNIVVLTGAGISTSLGIPDFRSDDGLYAQLSYLGLSDPQEVFDIRLFRDDPSIFYSVARKLLPDQKRFSPAHHFIKMLQDRGKLLRNYTQNIDNLEHSAGIHSDKIVQCHGSFGTAHCITCGREVTGSSIFDDIREGKIPRCPLCKPPKNDDEFDDASFGVIKPDITFFGEGLPKRFEQMLFEERDAANCDLLICMGTSLKVAPVSEVVKVIDPEAPQLYISRTPALHCTFEMCFFGSCDDVVELLSAKLKWPFKHDMAKRDPKLPFNEFPISEGRVGNIVSDDGYFNFIDPEDKSVELEESDASTPEITQEKVGEPEEENQAESLKQEEASTGIDNESAPISLG